MARFSTSDRIAGVICTGGLLFLAGWSGATLNAHTISLPLLVASSAGLGALVGRLVSVIGKKEVSA